MRKKLENFDVMLGDIAITRTERRISEKKVMPRLLFGRLIKKDK